MELTDTQKQTVAGWVAEGCELSEVQRRIASEFGIKMTYMDVRFLLLDLDVTPKDKPAPPSVQKSMSDAGTPVSEGAAAGPAGGNIPGSGGTVSVSFDKVVQPGAIVSGSATFSDGVSATWMLDQMGRLALNASQPGYRPSEEDVQQLQVELRNGLQKMGF